MFLTLLSKNRKFEPGVLITNVLIRKKTCNVYGTYAKGTLNSCAIYDSNPLQCCISDPLQMFARDGIALYYVRYGISKLRVLSRMLSKARARR